MFNWDFWLGLLQQHSLWLMFFSAFISATVLPANSELVFIGLASKIQLSAEHYFSIPILNLLVVATLGNSLGSLTTYWIGRWFPKPELKQAKTRMQVWSYQFIQRYGLLALLLAWLPIVGDLLCALAGWLRFNPWRSFLCILIGKALRYLLLLYIVIGYTFW